MNAVAVHEVERFRDFVSVALGLHFEQDALPHLGEVFLERLRKTGHSRPAAYWEWIATAGVSRTELRQLAARLTVPETYFYRHAEQYQAFAAVALHDRLMDGWRRRRPVRILSAGCASGEEAYSLAAVVRDTLGPVAARGVDILGIDVNPLLLEKARRARYSAWSLRATGEQQRQRYFRAEGREFVVHDALRAAVTFEERNLLEDRGGFWAPDAFDVVFCRNVMIYFAPETVRAVVARIAGALSPGGFLFLGPSETLRGVSREFHLCHTHGAFYYRRRRPGEDPGGSRAVTAAVPAARRASPPLPGRAVSVEVYDQAAWFGAIGRASQRIAVLAQQSKSRVPEGHRGARPAPAAPRGWDLTAARDLLRQERFPDVLETLRTLPPESEADPDVLLLRAIALTNGGDADEAERVCLRVLAADGTNAGAYYLRALCRERAGDRHAAVEHDRAAVRLDPTFAMPRVHLGLMARRGGDAETARMELRQALTLLSREDPTRIPLFGGGFTRDSLVQLCRSTLRACEGAS